MKISNIKKRKNYFVLDILDVDVNAENCLKILDKLNVRSIILMFQISDIKIISEVINYPYYFIKYTSKGCRGRGYNIQLYVEDFNRFLEVIEKILGLNVVLIEIYGNCKINEYYDKDLFLDDNCKIILCLNEAESEFVLWGKNDTYDKKSIIKDLYALQIV